MISYRLAISGLQFTMCKRMISRIRAEERLSSVTHIADLCAVTPDARKLPQLRIASHCAAT